jgi:hypothetical protein
LNHGTIGKNKTAQLIPEITLSIEIRHSTQEQKEAGRRLFSRLIGRAVAVGAAGSTAEKEGINKE